MSWENLHVPLMSWWQGWILTVCKVCSDSLQREINLIHRSWCCSKTILKNYCKKWAFKREQLSRFGVFLCQTYLQHVRNTSSSFALREGHAYRGWNWTEENRMVPCWFWLLTAKFQIYLKWNLIMWYSRLSPGICHLNFSTLIYLSMLEWYSVFSIGFAWKFSPNHHLGWGFLISHSRALVVSPYNLSAKESMRNSHFERRWFDFLLSQVNSSRACMGRPGGNSEASPKPSGGLNKKSSICRTVIVLVFLTKIKTVMVLPE